VFGASDNPYPVPGEWQLSASFRGLVSDKHFNLDERQHERTYGQNYVVNVQRMLDVGVTYAVNRQFSLSGSVPFVASSWSIPLPLRPVPGVRSEQNASGLGDITIVGRSWLRNTETHRRMNFSVGVGVKMPTGRHDATGVYPDLDGLNPANKAVDMSIQPGDGGWGVIVDGQAFRRIGQALVFASGTYLMNPRNTNGTPSISAGLRRPNAPITNPDRMVNSVPDQYMARAGVAFPLPWRGFAASAAWRLEGLPRYDLIGKSNGFRRPGYEMFIEPGLNYNRGSSTWSFNLPAGFYRIRKPDPNTNTRGDATFPDYIALASYSYRFGGKAR
jgi:hypothetical protein